MSIETILHASYAEFKNTFISNAVFQFFKVLFSPHELTHFSVFIVLSYGKICRVFSSSHQMKHPIKLSLFCHITQWSVGQTTFQTKILSRLNRIYMILIYSVASAGTINEFPDSSVVKFISTVKL